MDAESVVDRNQLEHHEHPRKRALSQFGRDMLGPHEKLDVQENIVLRNLMRNQEQRMSNSIKKSAVPIVPRLRESQDGRS